MPRFSVEQLKALGSPSLFGRGSPPVGIDFGTGSLKVLQLSGAQPASLLTAASIKTPEDLRRDTTGRLAFQIEALPRLLKAVGLKAKRAVCSIPIGETICKPLRVPKTEGTSLAAIVKAAAPLQLGVAPGSIVLRHVEVGDVGGGKTEVICLATSRELVDRLMAAVRAAKLEPVGIHNEFNALMVSCRGLASGSAPTLYVDLGAGATKAMIAHGEKMVFAKAIEVGGFHLDEALAKQHKIDFAEAAKMRRSLASLGRSSERGEGGVATAQSSLCEPLEILTDELSMCLRYHESIFPGHRVERVVFVGGEATHTALCQHVARSLRLPAQVGDPLARVARTGSEPTVGVDMNGAQPGWAVAVGLCLGPTDL